MRGETVRRERHTWGELAEPSTRGEFEMGELNDGGGVTSGDDHDQPPISSQISDV